MRQYDPGSRFEARVAVPNGIKVRPPRVLPLALEHIKQCRGRQRLSLDGYLCQGVESEREIRVRGIEQDHVPLTVLRYLSGDFAKEVAMGIS